MNKAKLGMGTCFAVALALLSWGCSGSAGKAAPQNPAGQHPANWQQTHWAEYVKTPDQCRSCHGSTSNPDAAGGISKVSCYTCHANGVDHPAGWSAPAQHGRMGAQLAPNAADPKAMAGFAHCAKCHGSNYDNGLTVSCRSCHTKAPHPDRPWTGSTLVSPSHVNTDPGNAPECFKCHATGANSTLKPATPAPAGTQPGCFNATMCHGRTIS
ncbi:hypothetical protein [Geothrix sp. 21YS21S-4]|uniref:hypothetical protein n=1 Tax=Geothrix sp. 21YS21S-4 TaxID=3068889 RepID=UPI0027B8FE38|nr:hypothetical protein [Geothrix sp. 21YS21S-4]